MEDQTASSSSSSVHSSSTSSAPSSTTSSALSCSTSLGQLDASATSICQDVKKTKKKKKKTKKVVVKKREEVVKKPKANDNGFIKERPKLPQSTVTQVKRKNEDKPPTAPQRKHLQRGPRVNYSEMDVPDDDHFLCE